MDNFIQINISSDVDSNIPGFIEFLTPEEDAEKYFNTEKALEYQKGLDTGIEQDVQCGGCGAKYWPVNENIPSWVYNSQFWYWTMSPYNDSASAVWLVNYGGDLSSTGVYSSGSTVRPVINVYKNKISS